MIARPRSAIRSCSRRSFTTSMPGPSSNLFGDDFARTIFALKPGSWSRSGEIRLRRAYRPDDESTAGNTTLVRRGSAKSRWRRGDIGARPRRRQPISPSCARNMALLSTTASAPCLSPPRVEAKTPMRRALNLTRGFMRLPGLLLIVCALLLVGRTPHSRMRFVRPISSSGRQRPEYSMSCSRRRCAATQGWRSMCAFRDRSSA